MFPPTSVIPSDPITTPGPLPLLRFNEMPEVEVHILESGAELGGIGEVGTPPVASAVANAVYAATGKRLRKLPLRLS